MNDEQHDVADGVARNRIDIFLDAATEPLLSTTPPLSFELDTSRLEDGPHVLRIEAYDSHGVKGLRRIDFSVRNGPGISVTGLHQNDVLDGKIPVVVNAYGGTSAVHWEPAQAETPAPVPTWAWVMLILFIAFGFFYGVEQWSPTRDFASTPTYGTFAGVSGPLGASAAAATPTGTSAAGGAADSADGARGAALYSANCAACHQATGKGLAGVFPPLAGDPLVVDPDPSAHIIAVLAGKQGSTINDVTYASPMPAFGELLNDADIAAIINHERTSWGNAAPTVSPADVAALR